MNIDFKNRKIEFTINELRKLEKWEAFYPNYEGDNTPTYNKIILPIISKICEINKLKMYRFVYAGETFANVFFYSDDKEFFGIIEGYTIYFSLYTPIAAFNKYTIRIEKDYQTFSGVTISNLIDLNTSETELERSIINILESNNTYVLSIKNAQELLPDDITPYEYCFDDEPWNKVFNILFSNTD